MAFIPLKKVAADLELSIATINKLELGLRFPTGRHFERLVMSPANLLVASFVSWLTSVPQQSARSAKRDKK
jgi:hypothetical protein